MAKLTIMSVENPSGCVSAYFNPKEVSFTKTVSWSDDNQGEATDYPSLQFTAGKSITCSVDLYFDEYETGGDIRHSVNKLMSFCLKHSQDDGERPPKVKLNWGGELLSGTSFKEAVIESVQVKYTMFTSEGAPCRGTATVALKQATGEEGAGGSDGSFSFKSVQEAASVPSVRGELEDKYGPIENIDFSKTGTITINKK